MKVAMNSLITLSLFAASALAQFTINTPGSVVECQPTQLTWVGGTPPYFLKLAQLIVLPSSILPGATPSGQALEQYTGLTGTSFTWNTNIAGGTSIGITLRDSTGAIAQTAPFTVNPGPDTSCLSASSGGAVSGSSTPAGSSPAVGSTAPASASLSTPAVSTPSATSPVTSAPASSPQTSHPASSGAASSASHSGSSTPSPSATGGSANGAVAQAASFGAAAFVGAAVIAILA